MADTVMYKAVDKQHNSLRGRDSHFPLTRTVYVNFSPEHDFQKLWHSYFKRVINVCCSLLSFKTYGGRFKLVTRSGPWGRAVSKTLAHSYFKRVINVCCSLLSFKTYGGRFKLVTKSGSWGRAVLTLPAENAMSFTC